MTIIIREPAKQARFLYQITWDLFYLLKICSSGLINKQAMRWLSLGKRKNKNETNQNKTKQNTQTHPHTIQREGKKEKEAQAGMTAYWSRLLTSKPAGMCGRLFLSCILFFLRLLAFFLYFSLFFSSFFLPVFMVVAFLFPLWKSGPHQQQHQTNSINSSNIAAATMQYPTTSATRNSWLPVVQPHCDSGRPYQDRVARQRNLGRPLPLARRKIPLPQPTNTPSPSLSLSLVLLSVLSVVCGFFFFFKYF